MITVKKDNYFVVDGVRFDVRFSFPRSRKGDALPCRGLITPQHPDDGHRIRKCELYKGGSNYPLDYPVYGKNRKDILTRAGPAAAAQILHDMDEAGILLPGSTIDAESYDMSSIASEFKATFFDVNRAKYRWSEGTVVKYSGQYDILVDELKGYASDDLVADVYRDLQTKICSNAQRDMRNKREWEPGLEAPPSAQTRLHLLYLLIIDLKRIAGILIPVIPWPYNGKPDRSEQLLAITDGARSLPDDVIGFLNRDETLSGQPALLWDAGLRISENVGLLWGSLRQIDGSQGPMYYLRVTGQTKPQRHRTEFGKSAQAYRVIPISRELGEKLAARRKKLEVQYGDVSALHMCADPSTPEADTSQEIESYRNSLDRHIPEILRKPEHFDATAARRAYMFDRKKQDNYLRGMLTCHALRREFCTHLLYCRGWSAAERYLQMGHSMRSATTRPLGGKTEDEIYQMCLRKHTQRTSFHSPHPLRYQVDGSCKETDVPACNIELVIPPHTTFELRVYDTEPHNTTTVSASSEDLSVTLLHQGPLPRHTPDRSPTVRDSLTQILSVHKLVGGD